jgi:hypothetical protein
MPAIMLRGSAASRPAVAGGAPTATRSALGPHSPEELQSFREAEAAGLPFLLWRDSRMSQRIFTLGAGGRLTIGRRASCDVVLDDARVSRVHAELESIAGDWALLDGGISHNGTFVNGEQIVSRRLVDRDLLRFGDTHVVYRRPTHRESIATLSASAPFDPDALQHPASDPLSRSPSEL